MSERGEKLQDAIGMVSEEYIAEAHGDGLSAGEDAGKLESSASGSVGGVLTPEGGADASQVKADMPYAYTAALGSKDAPAKKRPRAVLPLAIAACLVVAFVGVFGVIQVMSSVPGSSAGVPASEGGESTAAGSAVSRPESEKEYMEPAGESEYMADAHGSDALDAGAVGGSSKKPESDLNVGEANVLTAAVWNDNQNWPFFTNLVNAGTISFPSYGIDPRHRVKMTVKDAGGNPVKNTSVTLSDASGNVLWRARTDRDGAAYLFYRDDQEPATVSAAGKEQPLSVPASNGQQGSPQMQRVDEVEIVAETGTGGFDGLQVMFIMDTTGSMSDELAYLQKDFARIAADVGTDGVTYSTNFYRDEGDEYVTKCNGFTGDVSTVQSQLNDEYAAGGGDAPEAVAQALSETITNNGEWSDSSSKLAFLIFDAPPHEGTEEEIQAAVQSAAERGVRLVPVVSSNSERKTELFGRALAICTGGTYVFLTDDSGVGDSHLEPIVGDYTVERLHDVIVRIIQESR